MAQHCQLFGFYATLIFVFKFKLVYRSTNRGRVGTKSVSAVAMILRWVRCVYVYLCHTGTVLNCTAGNLYSPYQPDNYHCLDFYNVTHYFRL